MVKFNDKRHGKCEEGTKEIILKDDSIFLASRARICSYSGKGVGLWLVARPSICSFSITHSIFISTLCFPLNLIQLLTYNLLTCEYGHRLDTFGTHLVRCLFGGQWIVTHDIIQNVMYAFAWKSGQAVWKEWWYAFMSRVSLQTNLYITQKH